MAARRVVTTITSTVRQPGTHHWPRAHPERAYLKALHRHVFIVSATVNVRHDDRDVEFHDLQDAIVVALTATSDGGPPTLLKFGPRSCETIALSVLMHLRKECDAIRCSVSEDGENHATVTVEDLP